MSSVVQQWNQRRRRTKLQHPSEPGAYPADRNIFPVDKWNLAIPAITQTRLNHDHFCYDHVHTQHGPDT